MSSSPSRRAVTRCGSRRAGSNAWQQRPESIHAARDRQLRVLIRGSHEGSRRAYGSPRVLEHLLEQGIPISRKRVARLMQVEGLKARVRKRFRATTMSDHDQPIAASVLDRQFVAKRPNQRWVGDTTEFVIGSSANLDLAAIMDLHSRFIVGFALSAVNDRHLALSALDKAVLRTRLAANVFCIVEDEPMQSDGCRFESSLDPVGL